MAKDGTNRGGARVGAGRKKKALSEKILEGSEIEGGVLPVPTDLETAETLAPKEYLKAEQKDGTKLCSEEIYKEIFAWLKSYGCEKIVPRELLEHYAQVSGRYIYCEEKLSLYGMLAKHPTTGEPIASPFVKMSLDYLKQAGQLWYQIFQIVKENSSVNVTDKSNDIMENLLRGAKFNQL